MPAARPATTRTRAPRPGSGTLGGRRSASYRRDGRADAWARDPATGVHSVHFNVDTVYTAVHACRMRRKPPTRYHHGDLRHALVEGALRLLQTRTSAELSLRSVARLAGVSPNAPYRHFESKDALLASVAEEGFRRLTAITAAAQGPPRKRLGLMATAYVRFATDNPRLYGLMFGPALNGWDRYEGLVAAGDASFQVVVEAVAHATGADMDRAARDAILAWSAVHG
ncbi:MAG: TetR/AcrR family transcriptional regulator, partial [Phycisphaerales bacterium]|nr:TetR/AcrR family transcriptional regulator [Phycisphaerales bacterium]